MSTVFAILMKYAGLFQSLLIVIVAFVVFWNGLDEFLNFIAYEFRPDVEVINETDELT